MQISFKLFGNLSYNKISPSFALYYGSEWLVDGAKTIALDFGVSEGTIGISLIAIGTSIPELAASIIAINDLRVKRNLKKWRDNQSKSVKKKPK